jgi:hypothetical protein
MILKYSLIMLTNSFQTFHCLIFLIYFYRNHCFCNAAIFMGSSFIYFFLNLFFPCLVSFYFSHPFTLSPSLTLLSVFVYSAVPYGLDSLYSSSDSLYSTEYFWYRLSPVGYKSGCLGCINPYCCFGKLIAETLILIKFNIYDLHKRQESNVLLVWV